MIALWVSLARFTSGPLYRFGACALVISVNFGCRGPEVGSDETVVDPSTSGASTTDTGDDSPQVICEPGATRCVDTETIEYCAATGLVWEPSPCELYEKCDPCYGDELGNAQRFASVLARH